MQAQEGLFGFHAEWSAVVDCVCNDGLGLSLCSMLTTGMHGAGHDVATMLPVPWNRAELRGILEVLLPDVHAEHRLVLCAVGTFLAWAAQEEVGNGSDPTDMQGAAQLEIARSWWLTLTLQAVKI